MHSIVSRLREMSMLPGVCIMKHILDHNLLGGSVGVVGTRVVGDIVRHSAEVLCR